jgi:AraC family transcriptional regulator, exoenzyme S synthesis regulatory protein ExsA
MLGDKADSKRLRYVLIRTDKSKSILCTIKSIADKQQSNLAQFVERNYTQPWSLEIFAQESGRSLTTFKKEFKQLFDESPKKWINQKRLERARYLLKHSKYAVTEISHMAGYSNLSHFIQAFKKAFCTTPKQLQKA